MLMLMLPILAGCWSLTTPLCESSKPGLSYLVQAMISHTYAKVRAFVELAGSLLSAGAPRPAGAQQRAQPQGLSGEMLRSMRFAGVISALIGAMELLDADHPEVPYLHNTVHPLCAWQSALSMPLGVCTAGVPMRHLPGCGVSGWCAEANSMSSMVAGAGCQEHQHAAEAAGDPHAAAAGAPAPGRGRP